MTRQARMFYKLECLLFQVLFYICTISLLLHYQSVSLTPGSVHPYESITITEYIPRKPLFSIFATSHHLVVFILSLWKLLGVIRGFS